MTTKVKKIIFWVIVVVLLIGLGLWLKYTSFSVTVVTILVGLGGIVLGWAGKYAYDRFIARKE